MMMKINSPPCPGSPPPPARVPRRSTPFHVTSRRGSCAVLQCPPRTPRTRTRTLRRWVGRTRGRQRTDQRLVCQPTSPRRIDRPVGKRINTTSIQLPMSVTESKLTSCQHVCAKKVSAHSPSTPIVSGGGDVTRVPSASYTSLWWIQSTTNCPGDTSDTTPVCVRLLLWSRRVRPNCSHKTRRHHNCQYENKNKLT